LGDSGDAFLLGSSGQGSSVEATDEYYNPFIRRFIEENNIKTVVDLGCGDWQSSYHIYNNTDVEYYGYDAYENIVITMNKRYSMKQNYTFCFLDVVNDLDKVIDGDLYIIKDVLQHLNYDSIYTLLDNIKKTKKTKFILITNDTSSDNHLDIPNGGYRPINWDGLHLGCYATERMMRYTQKNDPRIKEIVLIRV
tara:strand:+ start:9028 stop:9609 length:582 start_codon:yes stop_codon:yes gene_type:complete